MHCDRAQEFLSDYLEQTLDRPTAAAVEGHLSACAQCRCELKALRETFQLLAAVPMVEPPADGARQVILQLRQARATQHAQHTPAPRFSFLDWLRSLNPLGVATGAGLATLAIGGSLLLTGQPHQQFGIGPLHRPPLRAFKGESVPAVQVVYGSATSTVQQLELRVIPAVDLPDAEIRVMGDALPVHHVAQGSVASHTPVMFQLQLPRQGAAQVLRVITRSNSRREQSEHFVVVPLSPRRSEPLTLIAADQPVEEVLRQIAPSLGRPIVVDGAPEVAVTVQVEEQSGRRCLDLVAERLGMTVHEENNVYRLVPTP